MICNNIQIEDLCKQGMIKPFNREMIQGASLDLRIGTNGKIKAKGSENWEDVNLCATTINAPFWVYPKRLLLIESLENIYLPTNIAAQFALKSSVARHFFQHMMAGWCDPGWHGKLTMEFINLNYEPYPVWVGKEIGQLIFHQLEPVSLSYEGKYQKIFKVSESKEKWN